VCAMRYLVTGAAGFLGSAVTRALVTRGHEVMALDNYSRGRPDRLAGVGCDAVEADVRNAWDVTQAAQGCDAIIHLAYMQGTANFYEEPRQVLDVAVRGMTSIVQACENNGIRELLLVSSSEAYEVPEVFPTPETTRLVVPDPLNPRFSYGGGKIISELMAVAWQRTGVLDRVMIIRPHNIVGPDSGTGHVVPHFAQRMDRLARLPEYNGTESVLQPIPFPIQGSGHETRSLCWIGDFVHQVLLVLSEAPDGTEIYHLGTEDERTVAQIAHEVAAVYNREIKIVPGTLLKGSPTRRLPDTRKVRALGYLPPPLTFAETIWRTVEWYRANPGSPPVNEVTPHGLPG
jgi:nucleoside-diphosphate-sugar epimerase